MQLNNKTSEITELSIENLVLWTDNPRIVSVETEKDAILQLFQKDAPGMFNLIKDICENGLLSANNLLVSPVPNGKFLVIEGNRRISALKCILDPDILKDTPFETYSKKILKLNKENLNLIKNRIKCSVDSKESQIMQLEKIHNGEMKGTGRIEWGSFEKDKFMSTYKNNFQSAKISTLLLTYLEENPSTIDEKISMCIRSISPTNIDRLLGFSIVKKHLGLKDYSIINLNQLNEICSLLLYFYNAGNKVELIYRKDNTLKLLENFNETAPVNAITHNNYDAVIDLNKISPIKYTKDNQVTKDISTEVLPSSIIEDDREELLSEQIELNQTKELLNTETPPKTKKFPKPNNFFDALSWSSLKPNIPRENGIIVLCSELKSLSRNKDYIKYPTAASIIMRALFEQTLIFYACKNKSSSSLYNRILKGNTLAHQSESFKPLEAILKEYLKDASDTNDKKSIFYQNNVLSRTFKSFTETSGTKDFLNMVIHNPSYVKANYNTLEAIAQQGFFSFINEILNT